MSEQRLERTLHLPHLPAWRLVVALWGGLALLDTTRLIGAGPAVQLAAVTVLVASCSYGVTRTIACCVAAIGWLLVNGFVVHDLGQLGFTGVGDVIRAVLFLGVALYAAGAQR